MFALWFPSSSFPPGFYTGSLSLAPLRRGDDKLSLINLLTNAADAWPNLWGAFPSKKFWTLLASGPFQKSVSSRNEMS